MLQASRDNFELQAPNPMRLFLLRVILNVLRLFDALVAQIVEPAQVRFSLN